MFPLIHVRLVLLVFFFYSFIVVQVFTMRVSGSVLVFSMFILLLMECRAGGRFKARWLSKMKSKGGTIIPIAGEDIRQPWCNMTSIQQTIRSRGCETKTVINNLCYGQCRSFYIPHRRRVFESCSYCSPVSFKMKTIILNCPNTSPARPVLKNVKIITACSCRVCGKRYI